MNKAQMLQKLRKHTPTILTCIGAVGVVGTSVLTAKATVKATQLLDKATEEKGEALTEVEVLKVAAPIYVPAAIMGTATIACIFGANILNKRSQAALTSAYVLLERSYKEYKDKALELYGEERESSIRTEIAKDHYEYEDEIEGDDDDGKQLFYDEYSSRYFRAKPEAVMYAEYELNKMVSEDFGADANDYFRLMGLEKTDYGHVVGWESGQMYSHYWSDWVHFTHKKVVMDDGLECTIISVTEPLVLE